MLNQYKKESFCNNSNGNSKFNMGRSVSIYSKKRNKYMLKAYDALEYKVNMQRNQIKN